MHFHVIGALWEPKKIAFPTTWPTHIPLSAAHVDDAGIYMCGNSFIMSRKEQGPGKSTSDA